MPKKKAAPRGTAPDTLKTNWFEGDTFHSADINEIDAVINQLNTLNADDFTQVTVTFSGNGPLPAADHTNYLVFLQAASTPIMPDMTANVNQYVLKNTSTANITVSTVSSQLIDGVTTHIIPPLASRTLASDTTQWRVI
jgi:hypothetical protein